MRIVSFNPKKHKNFFQEQVKLLENVYKSNKKDLEKRICLEVILQRITNNSIILGVSFAHFLEITGLPAKTYEEIDIFTLLGEYP